MDATSATRVYINGVVFQLDEIVQGGLEENEHFSLLSWVIKVYPSSDMMRHDDLQVDLTQYSPLLSPELLQKLEQEYLNVRIRMVLTV